ncbi:hypothetical protein I7U11_001614, partial [Campylobacter coli]|nr:hypothetical protein [Campylobacter coli]
MKHKLVLLALFTIIFSACSTKNNTNYNYLFDDKNGWVAINNIKEQEKFLKIENNTPVFEKKETLIKENKNTKKKKIIVLKHPTMSYVILRKNVNDSNSFSENKIIKASEF